MSSEEGTTGRSVASPPKSKRAKEKKENEILQMLTYIDRGLFDMTESVGESGREIRRRIRHVAVVDANAEGPSRIEVINERTRNSIDSASTSTIKACGRRCRGRVEEKWSTQIAGTVTQVAANRYWTAVRTGDGYLTVYSTETGDLFSSQLIDSGWSKEEMGRSAVFKLDNHKCLLITHYGLVRAW